MKPVLFFAALLMGSTGLFAQKYLARDASIRFFGSTPVENIEAISQQASAVLDASNGNLAFQVFMTSFTFEKALMQEHFNENYVESEKFPKATFKGQLVDFDAASLSKDGSYTATAKGTMNIHGVDKPVEAPVKLVVSGGKVTLSSTFLVKPEDYNIPIPSAVRDKIAEKMEVTVKANLQKQ